MLESSLELDKESSVKVLHLLTSQNKSYWSPILKFGGIEKLCNYLRVFTNNFDPKKPPSQTRIETGRYLNALSALCNLSDRSEVKYALCQVKDICDIFMKILEYSGDEDMESRVAILIADIADYDPTYKDLLADKGCLDYLISLLGKDTEDILVNAVNALETLCKDNIKNQNYCCKNAVLENLVDLLGLNSGKKRKYY